MQDTGHILFDCHGCGSEQRAIFDEQIISGERSFRDVSEEMWSSLNLPFEYGLKIIANNLDLDPDFISFHRFCIESSIPLIVISAGLRPVLRKVLDQILGEEDVRPVRFRGYLD